MWSVIGWLKQMQKGSITLLTYLLPVLKRLIVLSGAVWGLKFMTVFCRYFVFFLLRSPSVELYLHLILIHSFTLTQPHHNPSTPILKVTLSIWENLWGVRQFIQSVDVLRIQLWSRFGDEREAREDSWCVCVFIKMPFLKIHIFP